MNVVQFSRGCVADTLVSRFAMKNGNGQRIRQPSRIQSWAVVPLHFRDGGKVPRISITSPLLLRYPARYLSHEFFATSLLFNASRHHSIPILIHTARMSHVKGDNRSTLDSMPIIPEMTRRDQSWLVYVPVSMSSSRPIFDKWQILCSLHARYALPPRVMPPTEKRLGRTCDLGR